MPNIPGVPGHALDIPSMQNPSIVDWRLSPGSFASTPQLLIGEDGAETFAPATFATSTFHLRQVVRQADQPRHFPTAPPEQARRAEGWLKRWRGT